MAGEEPAYVPVGTAVSAKYKGAFCEAKVKKVVKCVKCKVVLKETGVSIIVNDEEIIGPLKVGALVDVKLPDSTQSAVAIINKITDASVYTVVFDDGDENTLRRSRLKLMGERNFIGGYTLEDLPLTDPEHFGTPVMKGGKGFRRRCTTISGMESDSDADSSDDNSPQKHLFHRPLSSLLGHVVCIELEDRKRSSPICTPALVVNPSAEPQPLPSKDHILVKGFRDSKFHVVSRSEIKEFRREMAVKNEDKTLKSMFDKSLQYFDTHELPQGWDREELLGEDSDDEEDNGFSSDDEPSETKDNFVAHLYKFMDDRSTPINKAPQVAGRDLDLFKLFRLVARYGGYNKVTNQMKWHVIYCKMNMPQTSGSANSQLKSAYKKYLHAFEDFYRKLGSTMHMGNTPLSRPSRSYHSSGRNLMSFRDREGTPKSPRSLKKSDDDEEERVKTVTVKEEVIKDKVQDKVERPVKITKEVEKLKTRTEEKKAALKEESESENESPRRQTRSRPVEEKKNNKEEKDVTKPVTREDMSRLAREDGVKTRQEESKKPPDKSVNKPEKRKSLKPEKEQEETSEKDETKPKRKTRKKREEEAEEEGAEERPEKTERKSSRKSREPREIMEKDNILPVVRELKESDKDTLSMVSSPATSSIKDESDDDAEDYLDVSPDFPIGSKVAVKYGKGKNSKVYEAKVVEIEADGGSLHYLVHYAGWNNRYDEWILKERVANVLEKGDATRPQKVRKSHTSKAKSHLVKKPPRIPHPCSTSPAYKPEKGNRSPSTGGRSPSTGAGASPKHTRPTRSTSIEGSLSSGLPLAIAKIRSKYSPGHSIESDQQSRESDTSEDELDLCVDVELPPSRLPIAPKESDTKSKEISNIEPKITVERLPETRKSTRRCQPDTTEVPQPPPVPDTIEIKTEAPEPDESTTVKDTVPETIPCDKPAETECPSLKNCQISEPPPEVKMEPDVDNSAETEASVEKTVTASPVISPENVFKKMKDVIQDKEKDAVKTKVKKKRLIQVSASEPEEIVKKIETPHEEPKEISLPELQAEEIAGTIQVIKESMATKDLCEIPQAEKISRTEKTKKKTGLPKTPESGAAPRKPGRPKIDTADKPKIKKKHVEEENDQEEPLTKKPKKNKRGKKVEDKIIEDDQSTVISSPEEPSAVEAAAESLIKKDDVECVSDKVEVKEEPVIQEPCTTSQELPTEVTTEPTKTTLDTADDIGKTEPVSPPGSPAPNLIATPTLEVKLDDELGDEPAPLLSPIIAVSKQDNITSPLACLTSAISMVSQAGPSSRLLNVPLSSSFSSDLGSSLAQLAEIAGCAATINTDDNKAMLPNTPPETPEHSTGSLSPGRSSIEDEIASSTPRSEQEANLEVERLMMGCSQPPPLAGSESPEGCNTSTISNGSGGSSGNAPGSESEGPATSLIQSTTKRKESPEDPTMAKRRKRNHKRTHSDKNKRNSNTGKPLLSDSDEGGDMSTSHKTAGSYSHSSPHHKSSVALAGSTASSTHSSSEHQQRPRLRPSKYNFIKSLEQGKYLEGEMRITFLMEKIQEIRKVYMQLKSEVASIDRRRKRHRRKERHANEKVDEECCS